MAKKIEKKNMVLFFAGTCKALTYTTGTWFKLRTQIFLYCVCERESEGEKSKSDWIWRKKLEREREHFIWEKRRDVKNKEILPNVKGNSVPG